jgi:hypothetical protein
METVKQLNNEMGKKRARDNLQKRNLAFIKKEEKRRHELEELRRLRRYWNIDKADHNPPELPEMEMEPPSLVETEEQKKEFQTLLEFARHGKKVGEIKEKIDGVIKKTIFYQGSNIFQKVNQYVQSEDILITEEDVEHYLNEKSSFYFPKAPILYINGVALQKKPLAKVLRFNFNISRNLPVIRRRSLVFGKNPPKTKKRLSMPGAYILLDEKKYVVGYEFDRNFRGEPLDSSEISKHEWNFHGFNIEHAFIEKPNEYMSEELIHHLLKQGYVFFPSSVHLKKMTVPNLKQFQSKIREDGLIKVEDLIPEDGPNQTYIFTQPGLNDMPCLLYWDDCYTVQTSVPSLKIVMGNSSKIIGYRVQQQ